MNKRVTKIGWIVLAALLCLSLVLVPGCTTPAEEEPLCSLYIGSGQLDGEGIPPDFFQDVNVRKGFAYAFDYETYNKDALAGESQFVGSPVVEGLYGYNPDASRYEHYPLKAEEHLRAAWNGEVWEKGFKFTVLYNAGNLARKTMCEIMAEGLYAVNEKFQVSIAPISWATYVDHLYDYTLPMFSIGWGADYPHADNFISPFMASGPEGVFSHFQCYGSEELDAQIKDALEELDPDVQVAKYYELQQAYYDDPSGMVLAQTLGRRYYNKYMQGWYWNPIISGNAGPVWAMSKVAEPEVDIPFKNPDSFIQMTIGEPDSLDPAWAYDNASGEQISYLYDTLLFYDGESTGDFVPKLATEWEFNPTDSTYRFKIREGVKFHEGGDLTPEDVEYSFERWMVQDRPGGPAWLIYGPLLGVGGSGDVTFADIDGAVEVDGDSVVFTLGGGNFWASIFPQILCYSGAAIVDKEWCIAQGGWDGTEATWMDYNQPQDEGDTELFDKANGTGPWKLNLWEKGSQIKLERFDDYWGEPVAFDWVITQLVTEWTTRKLSFLNGDADYVDVPRAYIEELEDVADIVLHKDLPNLGLDAFFFNMCICGPESEH